MLLEMYFMPKKGSGQGMTGIRAAMVGWPPGGMAQFSVTWNVREEPALRAADCSVGIVFGGQQTDL